MANSSGWDDLCHEVLQDGWGELSLAYVDDNASNASLHEALAADILPANLPETAGPTHLKIPPEHLKLMQVPQAHYHNVLMEPFRQVLASVAANAADDTAGFSPDIPKIADFFLGTSSRLHSTKETAGHLLQVDPKSLEKYLGLVVDTLIHLDRQGVVALQKALAVGAELVMFLELTRYDETPMRVTHDERVSAFLPQEATASEPQPPAPSAGVGQGPTSSRFLHKELQHQQRLQHRAALCHVGQGGCGERRWDDRSIGCIPRFWSDLEPAIEQ